MGVSIEYYYPVHKASGTFEEVEEKFSELSQDIDWYIEPVNFSKTGGLASGDSKLFRFNKLSGKKLTPEEEAPKVLADIKKLIEILSKLSKSFGMQWNLDVAGGSIGSIDENGLNDELEKTLQEMIIIFGGGFSDKSIEEASKIRKSKPWWKFW